MSQDGPDVLSVEVFWSPGFSAFRYRLRLTGNAVLTDCCQSGRLHRAFAFGLAASELRQAVCDVAAMFDLLIAPNDVVIVPGQLYGFWQTEG